MNRDPDDGEKGYKYSHLALMGNVDPACGAPEAPCDYDGTSVVSPNILGEGPFTVRLDVPAASSFWVVCLIHHGMRMEVDVVDAATPVQTQAEIDAATAAKQAQEAADAEALHEQMLDQHQSHDENGQKVWDVFAGFDTEDFALHAFYPARQKVRKGQAVEWHFGSLVTEDHSASMNVKQARRRIVRKDFLLHCDPDGDAGAGPDTPPELEGPPFCNDPLTLEFDAAPKAIVGAGNGNYRGKKDLESSPISGANLGGEEAFQVDFTKKLDKSVNYMCVIHPHMRAKIVM
ncbi:MAG: hypothetical protein ACRDLB_03935 [Actinomycetota bacterium]